MFHKAWLPGEVFPWSVSLSFYSTTGYTGNTQVNLWRFLYDDYSVDGCSGFSVYRDWSLTFILSSLYFCKTVSLAKFQISSMYDNISHHYVLFMVVSSVLKWICFVFCVFRWHQIFNSKIIATLFEYGNFYFNVVVLVMALLLAGKW